MGSLIKAMDTSNPISITSLEDLINKTTVSKKLKFRLEEGGDVLEIEIRPLNSMEMAAANKFIDHVPPKVKGGRGEDEFDIYNPDHRKKMEEGARLRRAFVLDKGLVAVQIPGEKIEDKANHLDATFPPRVLEFLQSRIIAISSGDMEVLNLANFTSAGSLEASPAS